MNNRVTAAPLILLLSLLASSPAPCQQEQPPAISGLITRIASPADFDVNGIHVQISPKTSFSSARITKGTLYRTGVPPQEVQLHLGQRVDIYGSLTKKPALVKADSVTISPTSPANITGSAVIDAVLPLPATSPADEHLLHADGFSIRITGKTTLKYAKPLASPDDIHANTWISYEGTQQPDGSVLARKAEFTRNTISSKLDKQRKNWEYDPAAISSDTNQSGVERFFHGVDPKRYPPYPDAATQARIQTIGAKLIPSYQAALPSSEPARIDFRFYLVDAPKWLDAYPLPNGIVLVPHTLVERMQNDSQLAAVLADKIARLLEKQPVPLPASDADIAMCAAEDAAIALVPFAAFAEVGIGLPVGIANNRQARRNLEQRERVSLSLLHDAGYDLTQAPLAFWLLAPKEPKDLAEIPIPQHSLFLYQVLGTTWSSGLGETPSAASTGQP